MSPKYIKPPIKLPQGCMIYHPQRSGPCSRTPELGDPNPSAHSRWKHRAPSRPVSLGTCRWGKKWWFLAFSCHGFSLKKQGFWMIQAWIIGRLKMLYPSNSRGLWLVIVVRWNGLCGQCGAHHLWALDNGENMGISGEYLGIWWLNVIHHRSWDIPQGEDLPVKAFWGHNPFFGPCRKGYGWLDLFLFPHSLLYVSLITVFSSV